MLLLSGLTSILTIAYVLVPVRRYYHEESKRNFDRKLKLYKIWTIRNYYPELANLSLEEIEQQYNVEQAYHNMGRRYLSQPYL